MTTPPLMTTTDFAVRDIVRELRPPGGERGFAVRFETAPGHQAQVDFAQFQMRFDAAGGVEGG